MRAVSVSFNAYVSSKIGAQGMGLITLCMSVYGFAITFATSGINITVVRLISAVIGDNENCEAKSNCNTSVGKIMRNAIFYCLIFSITGSIVLYVSAKNIGTFLLGDVRTISSIKLLSFTLMPISLSSAINGYFCAVRRVYKNVVVQLCEQGVKIGIVTSLLLLIAPAGLEYACISVIGGGAISEGASVLISAILYFYDRKVHFSKKRNTATMCRFFMSNKRENAQNEDIKDGFSTVFSVAFPIAIGAYVRSALGTIEHLIIPWGLKQSGVSSASALASYGILHGMTFPILLFPSAVLGAFSSLLVPELSASQSKKDYVRIRYIVSRVFALTLIFSIGVSGIFICFSHEIGMALYSNEEVGRFIKLISPLIPLMYLDGAVDTMLKGLGEQLYTMRVNIFDSLTSVILIIILLPSFGIEGYVAVIFITELLNTSMSIIRLLDITDIKTPVITWVIKPLIMIILSTYITKFIFDFNILTRLFHITFGGKLLIFVQILISSFLYIIFTRISGAISKSDTQWFRNILSLKGTSKHSKPY